MLLAARDAGVSRVVAASSSSVYGDGGTFPRVETQQANPISPYAVAKLAAERFCVSFFRVYGIETVALRYFNVFGPRQDPSSQYAAVVPLFVTAIKEGRPITIFGDGEQSRDFTYVENVVAANLAGGHRRRRGGGHRAQHRGGRLRDGQHPGRHDRQAARACRSSASTSRAAQATSSSRGRTSRSHGS